LRDQVIELLTDLKQDDSEKLGPVCPVWNVRNSVSPITGVLEDILEGRMTGMTTDPWARAQVDRHEHDLREACDKRGAQDSLAVIVACAWLFSHDQFSDEFIEPLHVLEIALPSLAIVNSL
jgi:hypothetical protein